MAIQLLEIAECVKDKVCKYPVCVDWIPERGVAAECVKDKVCGYPVSVDWIPEHGVAAAFAKKAFVVAL